MTGRSSTRRSLPLTQQLTQSEVPPGFWERNDHTNYPMTPLSLDFFLGHIAAGVDRAWTELTGLPNALTFVAVDGYFYGGTQPSSPPSSEHLAALEEKVRDGHQHALLARWPSEIRPALLSKMRERQEVDLISLSNDALLDHIHELDGDLSDCALVHFTNALAAVSVMGECAAFCRGHLGLDQAGFLQLLAGHSPESRGPVVALEVLAREALSEPAILQALESDSPWQDSAFASFAEPWLRTYGHRLLEFDLAFPTLSVQPERVIQLLKQSIDAARQGGIDLTDDAQGVSAAEAAALRHKLPDESTRSEFDKLLSAAQSAYGVRDDDNNFFMWNFGLIRRAALEAGRRLVQLGALEDEGQVWFLRTGELADALQGGAPPGLTTNVKRRMADHQRWHTQPPPFHFGTPSPPSPLPPVSEAAHAFLEGTMSQFRQIGGPVPSGAPVDTNATQVEGIAASKGTYVGPARVVVGEGQFDRIQPGDVLVCPITTPSWNVVLGRVGAIVADHGGILSHPAIIAREFGVPAVVGALTATKVIPDGAKVEVDGSSGTVRVLR